jgi:hypothetical protein
MDKKFIVAFNVSERMLDKYRSYSIFVFDQHAVHERVSLETILASNYVN